MQNIILTTCFCFFSLTIHLQANDFNLSIKKALELAADQQVQSQRVAKVYVALCNNVREPKFYQERDAAIETFDEQLHQLSLFTPTNNIKENIQNVRTIWTEYKKIAGWSIKKDAASKLLKQSTILLQATKALYSAYQDYEKTQTTASENSDLITIDQYIKQNNNQLILMQRIMLYYLAEKQGIDATASGHSLHDAQKVFARILGILEKSKITSKSIQAKLKSIRENWTEINQHLIFVNKDQSYVDDMLNRSDLISKTVKEITKSYRELGIKLNISYSITESAAQSMHVQRIAKSYIASVNDHIAYKYKKAIIEHVDDFEKKMNSMFITAQNDDIKRAINVVKTMWKNYKNLVTSSEKVDELSAIKIIEQSHVVMAACDRVSEEIEQYAQQIPAYKALSEKDGQKVDPSLDISIQIKASGKLRVYSQRLALYFIMKTLNLDSDLTNKRLQTCIQDFQKSFNQLRASRLNSPAIRVLLESCVTEWDWIQTTCKTNNKDDIDSMLEQTNMLSKKLAKLTTLYEHKMNSFFAEDIKEESPAALATPSKN
ncbi:type IV pili methyl-accepting chemotaxis transducer N-terminal domain-containing protein [Aureispira anguillae]|uniref:Type IV pili methyl-accepting chemotaxis transducer N-terminal domain-containing protein n=1 Tax=Aureispira anguillae TaxID=2864201 RepID=A0A915YDZ1_9BACT|nr:type IV pili methyl-accepting chemotaxis transducer N-terminal domain-containing protein [Aureispira anguillae]BDS11357.1 type IV pili methyl-accepting chemotaxis transducer N-terminal domain-containing protein [Aureispira anguillae]